MLYTVSRNTYIGLEFPFILQKTKEAFPSGIGWILNSFFPLISRADFLFGVASIIIFEGVVLGSVLDRVGETVNLSTRPFQVSSAIVLTGPFRWSRLQF